MKHERALDGWQWSSEMWLLKMKPPESAMLWADLDSLSVNTVHFFWWEGKFLPEDAVRNAPIVCRVGALRVCGMALLAVIPKSSL